MNKKILDTYKFTILISITLFVALMALRVEKHTVNILLLFFGSILGGLLLEADYFIQAYFIEPNSDFSRNLVTYIKHKDFKGALTYIQEHKQQILDKTLNSAIFQIVLLGLSIFVCSSNSGLFIKAFVLSAYANSIYRFIEEYYAKRTDQWFWAFKQKPSERTIRIYMFILALALVYCLYLV